jgi:hypothetical protein
VTAPANATHAAGAPPASVQTPDGRRWYNHSVTQEQFISVTTALGGVAKPGLAEWYGYKAGELAMEQLPALLRAAMTPPCGMTGPDRCRECITCAARWIGEQGRRESARRADEGQRLHFAAKLWIKLGCKPDFEPEMDDEIRPYFRQFRRFFTDHGLTAGDVTMSEVTVLNREHGYAGTLDIGLRVRASASWQAAELAAMVTGGIPAGEVYVIVDLKTREKPEDLFTPEMALQLAGYRGAETVMHPDGSEEPLPATDGGMVVQLHPASYTRRVVDTGPEVFAAFLQHLAVVRWQWEEGSKVAGVSRFPLPDEMKVNETGDFPTVEAALKRILVEHPDRKPAVKAMRARVRAERSGGESEAKKPARRKPAAKPAAKPSAVRQAIARDPFSALGADYKAMADEEIPF